MEAPSGVIGRRERRGQYHERAGQVYGARHPARPAATPGI